MNKSLVIPVFIPHSGCPHQCAFCNQSIITSQSSGVPDQQAIHRVIDQYLSYQGNRQRVEIAFFGGNFLGLPSDVINGLLEGAKGYLRNGKIHGIRFSTRPDTITRRKLDLIRPYPITVVELGVQSMNNRVLSSVKRGHTEKDTRHAVRLLKKYRYSVGVQVMTGLPGDTPISLMESTRRVAALEPEVARIYPLLVLKGSLLEQWYRAGEYTP
ncbi:MAG: radical SAM protein, partial [Desulfobacterales bacterium]|nr:radical SAM protein [Desulfobacterales bacterium]